MSKRKKKQDHFIPYSKGFKLPTISSKRGALGPVSEPETDRSLYTFTGHQSVPKCTSVDDWLAQYDEEGQTVSEFLMENPWFSRRKIKYMKQEFIPKGKTMLEKYPQGKIFILPIGELEMEVEKLASFASVYLGVPVSVLSAIETWVQDETVWVSRNGKKQKVTSRVAENGRFQINITSGLKEVRYHLEQNNLESLCVIGLTKYELYEDKTDLFVAGMASGNQRIAIFSILRYDPNLTFSAEFWYQVDRVSRPLSRLKANKLVFERSIKLLVHETMHLLGFEHCIYFECIMNGSGHLQEDFRQPMNLCPICLRKVFLLTKVDLVQRYNGLMGLYKEFEMLKEAKWVSERLELCGKNT